MGWSPSTNVVSTRELDLNASAVAEPGMEASDGFGIGNGVEAKEDGVLVEEGDSRAENDVGEKNTIGGSGSNGVVGKKVVDLERALEDEDLAEDTGDRMVDELDGEQKLEDGGLRIEEEGDDKTELVAQTQPTEGIIGEETKQHDDQDKDLDTKAKNLMGDAAMDAGSDDDEKVPVEEQQQSQTVKKRGRKRALGTSSSQNDEFPRYKWSSGEEKAEFSVPDLVWGKVRSHPWWPGQIFDPSDVSDMALRHNKKDNYLVAYFGDRTFAWCDESQLKPFLPHFSQMEKQSNLDAFVDAVDCALEEVSRRTELGMMCDCIPEEAYYNLKYQTVDNAGIREGTLSAAADRFLNASSFQPDRLLEYIGALAHSPYSGADNLDLVVAKAQLKAFYQSKGYPELPQFLPGGILMENDAETLPSQSEKSEEDEKLTLSKMISGKRKLKARRSLLSNRRPVKEEGRKQKSLSELMEVTLNDAIGSRSGGKSCGKSESVPFDKHWKVLTADSTGPGKNKKKRLDALGDLDTKASSPISTKPLKVGERISRTASQMACSPSIFEPDDGISNKALGKSGKRKGSTIVSDALPHPLVGSRRKKRNIPKDNSSPSEMLSQLCLVARDPMTEYGFESAVVNFFTGVRGMISSSSMEIRNHVGQKERKRGRKKSANSESSPSNLSTSEYKMDSYWSDIIFEDSPEKAVQTNCQKRQADSQLQLHKEKKKKKKKKKMEIKKPVEEASSVVPVEPALETKQKIQDGSVCSFVEKPAEECLPTTLILSFTESDALPSETDLIRIFGQYGPLDEAETEVMKKNNRAKVVFKKRADAEMAFSSAGKFSIFGPALVSYRLRYSTSKPKALPNSAMKANEGISTCEVTNSVVLGREVSAKSDNAQIPAQEATVLSDDAQVEVTAKGSSE